MGVPAHGAAALCMPGEKTGNKYAVSQYSAAFPQHQHRPYPAHPSRSRQIQTKRGIFSDDDDDDSRREHKRSRIVQAVVWSAQLLRTLSPHLLVTSTQLNSSGPQQPPKVTPPRSPCCQGESLPAVEADRDCKKILCGEQTPQQPCPLSPFSSVVAPPPGHRRLTSASRTPPPLARPRVKR